MKRTMSLITTLVLAAVLGGCASTPENLATLEQARSEIAVAEQNPKVQQYASEQLKQARDALRAAEDAIEERKPREQIEHLAYIALTKAQITQSALAEGDARERVAKGEAERNRVVLESRERELANATAEARTAQQAAQTAENAARQQGAQVEAAQAELMRLRQQLTELQAKPTDRGMVLTLGDVLFDVGRATLKPGADLTINRLGEFLQNYPDVKILIEGHTDSTGSNEYNEELSNRRAGAVASALRGHGISSDRFEVRGRGEDYPVANNDTNAGRQQNRRVEVIFSDAEGRFAGTGSSSSSSSEHSVR